jgi:membrane-associated protein
MIDLIRQLWHWVTDVQGIVTSGGTVLVCAIVLIETGLFVGFFLPGDSLLVTAGVFAASGHLDLGALLFFCSLCAILGDQLGYVIGHRAGQTLFSRPDSRFFKRRHLERTQAFYEKHGPKTIVIARFVPIVRTFAPAVAGAANMNYRRFVTYNIAGGLLWVLSMILLGYFLGRQVPDIDKNIHYVIAVVIVLSILPPIIEIMKERRRSHPQA